MTLENGFTHCVRSDTFQSFADFCTEVVESLKVFFVFTDNTDIERRYNAQQQQAKLEDSYIAASAVTTYTSQNPNETKHGGGNSK